MCRCLGVWCSGLMTFWEGQRGDRGGGLKKAKIHCVVKHGHLSKIHHIQLHVGKTRTWNFAGERSLDTADLGADVWNPAGVIIHGTPVGHNDFVAWFLEERLAEERKFWDAIPSIPDVQCSCAVRRASMSSSVAHGCTTTVCRTCACARFCDAAHDGSFVRDHS